MLFLTTEKDLILKDMVLVCFYSTDRNAFVINEIILDLMGLIEKRYGIKIICVDILSFNTFIKRFELTCAPTTIMFKDGIQDKRITGLKFTEIENIVKSKEKENATRQ